MGSGHTWTKTQIPYQVLESKQVLAPAVPQTLLLPFSYFLTSAPPICQDQATSGPLHRLFLLNQPSLVASTAPWPSIRIAPQAPLRMTQSGLPEWFMLL